MRSILVFRIGSLGDTLVSLPAFWSVREHFARDRITLLYDYHPRDRYVAASEVLRGSPLVDEFLQYPVSRSRAGKAIRPARMLRVLALLRRRKFDTLVYLVPSDRTAEQIRRDRRFFTAAGIGELLGMEGFPVLPRKQPGLPLGRDVHEADRILDRLRISGIRVPEHGRGKMDLSLGDADRQELASWLATQPSDGGRRWISIGPGAKQPVNVWPRERYLEVVRRLIELEDVWPLVLGGGGDREKGESLIREWGRGYNAAGVLSIRASAVALERCALHVGNDTGTIHLAAASKTPCVGVYSSRNPPGQWEPYGVPVRILRTGIDCEGCMLLTCLDRGMECILRIGVDQVLEACLGFLTAGSPAPAETGVDA